MYAVRALLVAAMAIGGAGDRHACLTKMIVTPAIHRELVAGADFPLNGIAVGEGMLEAICEGRLAASL